MSMLSAQCGELRLMARLVRDYDYKEISRMLREAADTIISLRDRLQDAELGSDDRYDAGFANGIQAVFQQLEGIEDYEELQDFIADYWGEGEGNDER